MADEDSDCFWFPELCPIDPEKPDPIPMPDTDNNNSKMVVSDPFISPIAGQLAFLSIALFNTAVPVVKNFRWRKTITGKDGYYDKLSTGTLFAT